MVMTFIVTYFKSNSQQNTQIQMKFTTQFEIHKQKLRITKNYMLFIYDQLKIQLKQCSLQSVAWFGLIFQIINVKFLKLPFQFEKTAKLNNEIYFHTFSILDQLMKRIINVSQKLKQQKLQFLKHGNINLCNFNKQSHSSSTQGHLGKKNLKIKNISTTTIRFRFYHQLTLVLLLLISSSPLIQGIPSCNNFPKVFGGSSGNTTLNQIDVYQDLLVIGGDTNDQSLTGTSNKLPFIALHQISSSVRIYWAKAFEQKQNYSIGGVKFSSDGALIIAHSYQNINITNFIVVINTTSGGVLSVKSYTGYRYDFNNNLYQSMLVSSGAQPIAYVLSNIQTQLQLSSSRGHILYKFDPLKFYNPSDWVKQVSGIQNTGNHGLTFGRSESFIYTLARVTPVISLLDYNGNLIWQYKSLTSNNIRNNFIRYKEIDEFTEMIIATSSNSYYIYLYKILSSSTSPYSVTLAQTYSFVSNDGSKIKGLYIIDQNNAIALIERQAQGSIDIATLDFLIPFISYNKVFPSIEQMTIAIFISPKVFYFGGYGNTDQLSFKTLSSFAQSIIYSSDISQTSCYSNSAIFTSPLITMNIIDEILSLQSLIYASTNVTFVNDTQLYQNLNLDISQLTKIDSWCLQYPFKLNSITQPTTNFTFKSSASLQIQPIQQFNATSKCGSYSKTWKYNAIDNSDGHTIIEATDFMSVNPSIGSILIKSKPVGTYLIKVIGSLPDQVSTQSVIFTIIILPNSPPYFIEEIQNQKVMINTEHHYALPQFKDPGEFQVKISFEPDVAKSFVQIKDKLLIFTPKYSFQEGITQLTIILTNEQNIFSYSTLNITVHSPPKFNENLKTQNLSILTSSNYTLPVKKNSKFHIVHSFSDLPRFVKFEYPTYFFHPERISDLGYFIINAHLCNEFSKIQFQLKINVTNQAPYLLEGGIPDIKVPIKSDFIFNFSEGIDREGQKINYEANERQKISLPSFITFLPVTRQFKIKTTNTNQIRDYNIQLSLKDDFNATMTYNFVITIFDPQNHIKNSTNSMKNIQKAIQQKYLSAKIQSINRQGLIVIVINETLDSPIFINNASMILNKTNIDIQLKPSIDYNLQNQYKNITQWQAISLSKTQLTIQVNFTDPSLISQKINSEDKIEIVLKDGYLLCSNNYKKCLPDNYVLKTELPRQIVLSQQIVQITQIISVGSKAMIYLVIGNILLQLFMSFSMQYMWGMMNNLQVMEKMLSFNVDVPSNSYIFFKYINEFLRMKVKFIEDNLEKFNQYMMISTGTSDKVSNISIVKNLGTIILGTSIIVQAMILNAILIKFSRVPLIIKISTALKNKLFYNSILRIGVQSYLQLSIIAFQSLDSYQDNTTLALGIIFLCLTFFFLCFTYIFLKKNQFQLSEDDFKQKFESLYLNIDPINPHSYYLTTIFLGRRFLLGIFLTFCDDHQDAQFLFMNITSFLIIIYLVKVRPLMSNYLNAIELFNEVILYGCTGLILVMTDYQNETPEGLTAKEIDFAYDSKQNKIGLAYIIMASITIITTIGGIIINFLIYVRTKLKEKCLNKAIKEEIDLQKHQINQQNIIKNQDQSTSIQNKSDMPNVNQSQQKEFEFQKQQKQQVQQENNLEKQQFENNSNRLDSQYMDNNELNEDKEEEKIKGERSFKRVSKFILHKYSPSLQPLKEIEVENASSIDSEIQNTDMILPVQNPSYTEVKDQIEKNQTEQKESQVKPKQNFWINKNYPNRRRVIQNQQFQLPD